MMALTLEIPTGCIITSHLWLTGPFKGFQLVLAITMAPLAP